MTKTYIKKQISQIVRLWPKYSCDCLHYELKYWEKRLREED